MPDYEVLNDYHLIEKSRSLVSLDEYSEYGDAQYILLDMYLSRINARDPDDNIVKFPKADYEAYKEVERVRGETLDKDLRKLMVAVKIPDPNDPKAFRIKPLFKECICRKEDDGRYWVTMICDDEMKDLFFNIKDIGYIKYRLGMLRQLNITSRFLYNNLCIHKNIKPYILKINEIKKIMKLNTKNFKSNGELIRTIKLCVEDINNKTNLLVSFEKINGSKGEIIAVRFVVNNNVDKIDEDLTVFIAELLDISYDEAVSISKIAQKNNLTDDEIEKRIDYVKTRSNIKDLKAYVSAMFDNSRWTKIVESKKKKEADSSKEEKLRQLADFWDDKLNQ